MRRQRQNRGLNLWDIGAIFLQTLIRRQAIKIRRHRYRRRTLRVLEEPLIQDLSECFRAKGGDRNENYQYPNFIGMGYH